MFECGKCGRKVTATPLIDRVVMGQEMEVCSSCDSAYSDKELLESNNKKSE